MKCCVSGCRNTSNFKFPSNLKLKRQWLRIIRRPNFIPKGNHGLCSDHFTDDDMRKESFYTGVKSERRRLCKQAVPSIFTWTTNSKKQTNNINFDDNRNMIIIKEEIDIIDDMEEQESSIRDINTCENTVCGETLIAAQNSQLEGGNDLCNVSNDYEYIEMLNNTNIKLYEEIVVTTTDDNDQDIDIFGMSQNENVCQNNSINDRFDHSYATKGNRENVKSQYNIENFKVNSEEISLLTGLQNYNKFMGVFHSLGRKTYTLKFKDNECIQHLSPQNQLFLILWKLKKNCTNCELSRHFDVPESAIFIIFKKWIIFMAKQWSKLDIWPSKKLVKYCIPENFKRYFPDTTVIIDGTKFHVEHPSQDSSFTKSSLQNKRALQDMLASNEVTILTPYSKKHQGNLSDFLMQDQKLSMNSDQIKKIIRHLKTYKIMSTKLCVEYLPLASKIVEICIMLCHFIEQV